MGSETESSGVTARTFESAPGSLEGVVVSEEETLQHVARLAAELAADYPEQQLVLVAVLNGAMPLTVQLLFALGDLGINPELESLNVDSYGASFASSGQPEVTFFSGEDRWNDFKDGSRKVVVVEDIVDSGRTIEVIRNFFAEHEVYAVAVVALLQKIGVQEVEVHVDHLGAKIPDTFVVGQGLDGGEQYRGLRDVRTLNPAK